MIEQATTTAVRKALSAVTDPTGGPAYEQIMALPERTLASVAGKLARTPIRPRYRLVPVPLVSSVERELYI